MIEITEIDIENVLNVINKYRTKAILIKSTDKIIQLNIIDIFHPPIGWAIDEIDGNMIVMSKKY